MKGKKGHGDTYEKAGKKKPAVYTDERAKKGAMRRDCQSDG